MLTNANSGEKRFYRSRLPAGRLLLTLWACVSLLWAGGVIYDLYYKVSTQARMSNAVERELDQGFTNASCAGIQCGGEDERPATPAKWSDIATTYVKFGRGEMAGFLFGPPVALFVIGLGGLAFYRHRQMNNRSFIHSRFE